MTTPRSARSAPHPTLPRPGVPRRRAAFTLVELLVVITIIAVLTALVTVAGVGFIGTAREAATRTTIKKVEEAILERVNAVNRWHQRAVGRLERDWEYRGWPHRWRAYCLDIYANTPSVNEARLVVSRKGMLLELLPVHQEELKAANWFWARFNDPTTPSVIVINDVPVPYLNSTEQAAMEAWLDDIDGDASNNVSGTSPGKPSDLNRPGEVFYYALLNAPVVGGSRVAEDEFRPSELIDPDLDGVMEIGDAWGRELRFYRWPTRLVNGGLPPTSSWDGNVARKALMPNAPKSDPVATKEIDLKVDPDDRAAYLAENNPCFGIPLVAFFHDPHTWHAPLVVSAGPDGGLGIAEPETPVTVHADLPPVYGLAAPIGGQEEALYDNITNHAGNGALQ